MGLAIAIQVLLLFGVPALLIWSEPRVRFVAAVSPVVLSYASGILAAHVPGVEFDAGLAGGIVAATVLIAVPLLLFPSDLRHWLRLARSTVLSFFMAVVAVCISAALVFVLLGPRLPAAADVSGMLTGLYTGGTPNMNAVALARGVDENTFILVNGADVILGSLYLLFLMTLAKPLLSRVFPPFTSDAPEDDGEPVQGDAVAGRRWHGAVLAVLLSVALSAVAAGLSWLLLGRISEAAIILGITSLAIVCTLSPAVRKLSYSYETGQYLLLVFCITIGTQADIEHMLQAGSYVLFYCACVLVCSVLLHLLAARAFGIDVDTVIITSTAAIYGPPFVGPIAKVLGNREVVVSGMTAGVFGLAIGNYLGFAIASLLASAAGP